jgi:hypothetical protein
VICAVTGNDTEVQAWSSKRLPFEPEGEMLAYRGQLRAALRALRPQPGHGLIAAYLSPDSAFVDVENAALYNVGAGAYGHLTTDGLVCRRGNSPDELHHLRYRVGPLADPDPTMRREIARLDSPVRGVGTAGAVWADLCPTVHVAKPFHVHSGPFTVDLTVCGNWSGPGVAGLVKPVLDGLISALHQHDGSHQESLMGRLSVLGDPDALWRLLVDPTVAILGARQLLRPHGGSGVAWNPADDLCTAFRVRREAADHAGLAAVVTAT